MQRTLPSRVRLTPQDLCDQTLLSEADLLDDFHMSRIQARKFGRLVKTEAEKRRRRAEGDEDESGGSEEGGGDDLDYEPPRPSGSRARPQQGLPSPTARPRPRKSRNDRVLSQPSYGGAMSPPRSINRFEDLRAEPIDVSDLENGNGHGTTTTSRAFSPGSGSTSLSIG